jgi:anti-sigma B factor antagonist
MPDSNVRDSSDEEQAGSTGAATADQGIAIRRTDRGGVPVVAVAGEVDVAGGPVLDETLDALAMDAPALVVVDLSEVTFIDSSGLSVLVLGQRRLAEGGGELRLVVTNHQVQKVLAITALDAAFTVADSVDAVLHD